MIGTGANRPLFIRPYWDEDVFKGVAPALRARGFDAVSVHDLQHYGWSDNQHLTYASDHGRAVFSFNAVDYLALYVEYISAERSHAGIVVAKQLPIRETIRRLLDLLNRVTGDELRNQLWRIWSFGFRGTL